MDDPVNELNIINSDIYRKLSDIVKKYLGDIKSDKNQRFLIGISEVFGPEYSRSHIWRGDEIFRDVSKSYAVMNVVYKYISRLKSDDPDKAVLVEAQKEISKVI